MPASRSTCGPGRSTDHPAAVQTQPRDRATRQYRTCLLMLPRKNGKTELAAALAIYGLLFDGEIGAEVYSAAADKDQAALVFNVAAQMIRNDPELLRRSATSRFAKAHRAPQERAVSIARSRRRRTASTGSTRRACIYDELHAAPVARTLGRADDVDGRARATAHWWRFRRRATTAIRFCGSSTRTRRRSPSRSGARSDVSAVILYEAPIDADWTDEKVWHKANPALGDFRIARGNADGVCAREGNPRAGEHVSPAVPEPVDRAGGPLDQHGRLGCLPRRRSTARGSRGRRCYVGLDLELDDGPDGARRGVSRRAAPGSTSSRSSSCRPTTSRERVAPRPRAVRPVGARGASSRRRPGNVVDYELRPPDAAHVAGTRNSMCASIAYDPWNATDLVTRLEEQDGLDVRESAPGVRDAVGADEVARDGDPLARRCATTGTRCCAGTSRTCRSKRTRRGT